MSKFFQFASLAGALGAVALATAPATTVMAKSSGPVQCELRVSPANGGSGNGGIVLTGLARSSQSASGRYTLTIAKDGDASGADMQQEGSFTVAAGGASTLSEVSMSLEPGASYSAVLTLSWGGGRITCRQALSTRI